MIQALDAAYLGLGLGGDLVFVLSRVTVILAILAVAVVGNLLGKLIIRSVVGRIVTRTRTQWDDVIYKRGVLNRLSHLVPAIIVYVLSPVIFPEVEIVPELVRRLAAAYMIAVTVLVVDSALEAGNDIYNSFQRAKRRPIKGYVQLVKILVYIVGIILIVTTILQVSAVGILSGLGAMSAVILLVFRDSILGFVSSIQLSGNDMVHIGDWIEMPKYGADGDVVDITLQSIKVQNWDKTITTIPIYALVSDSFKNWRGMQESGGRRIKRALNIDMRTVRLCTPDMLDRFERFHLIRDYLAGKRQEVADYNRDHGITDDDVVSGRALTNLGTFRAYVAAYLRNHPKIHPTMTFLVRHLPPGPTGLPLEIYVFSADQVWAHYEGIQADIFDHLIAVLPEFGLRVYQEPSGYDLQEIGDTVAAALSGLAAGAAPGFPAGGSPPSGPRRGGNPEGTGRG